MARSSSSKQPRYSTGRDARGNVRGRQARPIGSAPLKRRGPAPILIIAIIIVALVFCWVFGRGCSGGQRAKENSDLRAYTNTVNKLMPRSSAVASQFDNLKNGVKNLSRDDVDKRLSPIESDCVSIAREFGKVVVPSKAKDLQPILKLTLDFHAQGVDEFRTGIINVLDNKNVDTAAQSISKGLTDLVVGDLVFQHYRSLLGARLKSAGLASVQVADAGQFVPRIDDIATASVNDYILTKGPPSSGVAQALANKQTTAATPAVAMTNYLQNKGMSTTGSTFSVVSASKTDPSWKLDKGATSGSQPSYFILHDVNGVWTVVDYGASFTATQMKADGAPVDLSPP